MTAPLYGRLTAQIDLTHWDFQDLLAVFGDHAIEDPYQWLTLWSFFEGVPKFYRDAFERDLFRVPASDMPRELLRRMFLASSSPLSEEADTRFLREFRGRGHSILTFIAEHPGCTNGEITSAIASGEPQALGTYLTQLTKSFCDDRQAAAYLREQQQ